jgi:hypothetical protein
MVEGEPTSRLDVLDGHVLVVGDVVDVLATGRAVGGGGQHVVGGLAQVRPSGGSSRSP